MNNKIADGADNAAGLQYLWLLSPPLFAGCPARPRMASSGGQVDMSYQAVRRIIRTHCLT